MAKPGTRITVDNFPELMEAVRLLTNDTVYVGIPDDRDDRKSSEPIGNAGIGYVQENGSAVKNIPPRPFLGPGVDAVREDVAEEFAAGALAAMKGRTDAVLTSYNRAGLRAVNSVKRTITAGEGFEPLSDSTLDARRRRGVKRTKPLIDTGQLRSSITYTIRKRVG